MRRPALLLLFLCFLTFFAGLGRPAITDADEAFYAESAREMVESADWLTPYYNYEYRWQKPVLYYWLTASTYVLFGVNEWAARFWAAMAGLGLAFTTCAAGRRLSGHDDVGFLAGAIVATSFGYFALGRMALPDLPLAFLVTLAIAAAFEGSWVLAAVAAGLSFVMKGPVSVVLVGLVLFPIWWRERRTATIEPRTVVLSGVVFACVALPWYVGMTIEHGAAYLNSFFVGDNLERFATQRFNSARSPLFYIPILLGGLLPWTAYLLTTAWCPAREFLARRLTLSNEAWRLIIWAGVPFLFFSASIGKQPRYILPILPPVAILLAIGIVRRIDAARNGDRAARRELALASYATAGLLGLSAIMLGRARELFINAVPELTWIGVGALIASAIALSIVARRRDYARLPIVVPICAAMMLLAVEFGALAGRRPEPVEEMAALVTANRTGTEAIGVHHVFVRNLVFYTGMRQEDLFADDRAAEFMRAPERVLMVVRDDDLERLEAGTGVRMKRLGEVRYFNSANVKLRDLFVPDAARLVQRVLLVANR